MEIEKEEKRNGGEESRVDGGIKECKKEERGRGDECR